MRLVMMGTGAFAVPTISALIESPHEVVVLVTRPPHGRRPPPNPMRELAASRAVPVWMPETVGAPEAAQRLRELAADLLVVCDYGEILSPEVLQTTRLGGINLHASQLPKYRGAAPINWAILRGEKETGNTVFRLTPGLDAGPTIAQSRLAIGPEETAAELKDRLAQDGAVLVRQAVDDLASGNIREVKQDRTLVTRAPRLQKSQGQVDWSRSAAEIKNQVRALQPWPTTYTFWHRPGHEPLRLILEQVLALPDAAEAEPGTVVETERRLVVTTGEGLLELCRVRPAGKRVMQANEFLRGHPVLVGQQLGPLQNADNPSENE
ncbi:MAG: methionyl-tRNA formyltransferase [Pirellulales bacterium]